MTKIKTFGLRVFIEISSLVMFLRARCRLPKSPLDKLLLRAVPGVQNVAGPNVGGRIVDTCNEDEGARERGRGESMACRVKSRSVKQ